MRKEDKKERLVHAATLVRSLVIAPFPVSLREREVATFQERTVHESPRNSSIRDGDYRPSFETDNEVTSKSMCCLRRKTEFHFRRPLPESHEMRGVVSSEEECGSLSLIRPCVHLS